MEETGEDEAVLNEDTSHQCVSSSQEVSNEYAQTDTTTRRTAAHSDSWKRSVARLHSEEHLTARGVGLRGGPGRHCGARTRDGKTNMPANVRQHRSRSLGW